MLFRRSSTKAVRFEPNSVIFDMVGHGQIDAVKTLVDINSNIVNIVNELGVTPVLIAAHRNHLAMVKVLVNAGADVDVADSLGQVPLFWARYHNNSEMIAFIEENSKKHGYAKQSMK